jgi:hypothetical protein
VSPNDAPLQSAILVMNVLNRQQEHNNICPTTFTTTDMGSQACKSPLYAHQKVIIQLNYRKKLIFGYNEVNI